MADIITKLLLNDKDYSSKLDKAKKSTKDYKSEMDNLGKSIGGGITKAFGSFAAAVGVAGGVVEAFNKTIKSSQTAADAWDKVIRAAKSSVDTFFTALSTGDFSGFLGGLNTIIERAKQASVALDALGNAQMSYGYFTTANQADFSEAMTVMRDQNASYGDRMKAKETADAILGDQQELVTVLHQKITNAVQSVLGESNYLTTGQIERVDLNKILSLDITQSGDDEKARLEAEYQQYLNEIKAIPKPQSRQQYVGGTQYGQAMYVNVGPKKEEVDAYNAQLTAVADKYKDAVLYNTVLVKMTDEQLQNLIQMTNQMDSADKLLADWQKQLNKVKIEAPEVEPIETDIIVKDVKMPPMRPIGITVPQVSANIPDKISLPATEVSDVNNELIQTAEISADAAAEVNALASAMSSLGEIVSGDAENWLTWGANVVSAVANAIPAFEAAAMASRSKATADSASAVAGGASAVANIPYAGPALAVAAALSIAAAIAAAPQFATGGVVPGVSFTGDNVLARVNSQEMILTREQQNILSDRLTSANSASQVRFVIEGNNLVGILNNWNRFNSRRS